MHCVINSLYKFGLCCTAGSLTVSARLYHCILHGTMMKIAKSSLPLLLSASGEVFGSQNITDATNRFLIYGTTTSTPRNAIFS